MTLLVILVTSLFLCAQTRVLPTTDSEEETKNFKIYPNKRKEGKFTSSVNSNQIFIKGH